jgi:ATP-dependent RNA helicase MSS116
VSARFSRASACAADNSADSFGRAKTGTGKTMAFLIPLVQRVMQTPGGARPIAALIITPTRELATQIVGEAQKLLAGTKLNVEMVIGGTNINKDSAALKRAHILVATPGRLADHLQNTPGMDTLLKTVKFYVLDEADRLLDGGFQRELNAINAAMPNRATHPRQSLLFSATVSREIQKIAQDTLAPNHQFISTVNDAEAATHAHVPQTYLLAPQATHFAAALAALAPYARQKAIVFLPTAREAELWHAVLEHALAPAGGAAWALHSRLSQPRRDKNTQAFREAAAGVMVASDVLARGIDIPDVSFVLQVGLPANAEQCTPPLFAGCGVYADAPP